MCTAINIDGNFFARTLDYERSFGEQIIITPRERVTYGKAQNRYATIGIGVVKDGSPLYFDGMNEWGLAVAALNFPGYAAYQSPSEGKAAVSAGRLAGLILGFCRNIDEVKSALDNIAVTEDEGGAKLHWLISDRRGSITVEPVEGGLRVYDNPVGVLTNSPDFPFHLTRLADYAQLHPQDPENRLARTNITPYSRGMGAIGLPGDFSSSSRFVRGVFVKENTRVAEKSPAETSKAESSASEITRIFHIADAVSVPCGCVVTEEGRPVSTIYTVVFDLENLNLCFTTYNCRRIRAVKLTDALMTAKDLQSYPLYRPEEIEKLN